MFGNALSVENTKIFKRRMLWIELGILAVLIILVYTIIYVTMQTSNDQTMPAEAKAQLREIVAWPGAIMNALSFGGGNSLGGLLVIVLIGAATAQEYTWRTMHLWLSRGVQRPVLVGAKFVALLLPILLFVVTPLIVGGGLTAIFTLQLDKSLPFGQIQWGHLFLSVLRTAYTILPYAALTFMLAIVTRSTAAAIGVGLAYTLLIESLATTLFPLLGGILKDIVVYLPGTLSQAILKLNATAISSQLVSTGNSESTLKLLAPTSAAIGIALWTILFIGIALWSFRKQDLSD
jgi:ABC-2 type transport system permease protein